MEKRRKRLLLLLVLLRKKQQILKAQRKRPNRVWARKKWEEYFARLTDEEFQKRFRMSKVAFGRLVTILQHVFHEGKKRMRQRRILYETYWMPPEIKVAITL